MQKLNTDALHAYVPYSGKQVICIAESESGNYYAGVRIENISFPLTISAVQAACSICLSEGETPVRLYLENESAEQLHTWKKEFNLDIQITDDLSGFDTQDLLHKEPLKDTIKAHLKSLLPAAVTPNSDFPVSALLFCENGYFEGVNVEISDWNQGLCAERVALAKAVAAGYREFDRMEIHTRDGEFSSPCGACRQVLIEHLPYHTIVMHHADGSTSEHKTVDLLPLSFKSSTLQKHT